MTKKTTKTRAPRADHMKLKADGRVTQVAAAAMLGVTSATIKRWETAKKFVAAKWYGGKLKGYSLGDVKAWAKANGYTLQAA